MDCGKVRVSVLFFAKVREITSKSSIDIEFTSQVKLADIINQILELYPTLKQIQNNLIIALNQNYIDNLDETLSLKEGDEIALIPPISGG